MRVIMTEDSVFVRVERKPLVFSAQKKYVRMFDKVAASITRKYTEPSRRRISTKAGVPLFLMDTALYTTMIKTIT